MDDQQPTDFQNVEYTQLNVREKEVSRSRWKQYIAGIAACISLTASGAWFCWPTPLLPLLLSPDSPVPMTVGEVSWMVSCVEVGTLISPLPASFIADRLGRKHSLLLSTPLFAVSAGLKIYLKKVFSLYLARFFQGMALGIPYTILPLYLGEIASPDVRGTVSSFFHISWSLGCLFPYCVGPYLSYNALTYVTFLLNIVFVLCFFWQPESPYYYALKRNTMKATEMLTRLRDSSSDRLIETELKEIQAEVRKSLQDKASWKDVIATPADKRALLLVLIVGVVSFLSGQNAMLTYTTDTFSKMPNNFLSPEFITIAIGVIALVGSIFSILASDSLGRRFLLLMSSITCSISLFVASAVFYLISNTNFDVSSYSWVAPIAVMAYNLFVTAGMHPVCVMYTSELFPTKTRGTAASISNINLTLCSFLVLKFYEPISFSFGVYFTYLIYTLTCIIGTFLFYFMMPETKGKSFLEIRELLEKSY